MYLQPESPKCKGKFTIVSEVEKKDLWDALDVAFIYDMPQCHTRYHDKQPVDKMRENAVNQGLRTRKLHNDLQNWQFCEKCQLYF